MSPSCSDGCLITSSFMTRSKINYRPQPVQDFSHRHMNGSAVDLVVSSVCLFVDENPYLICPKLRHSLFAKNILSIACPLQTSVTSHSETFKKHIRYISQLHMAYESKKYQKAGLIFMVISKPICFIHIKSNEKKQKKTKLRPPVDSKSWVFGKSFLYSLDLLQPS